jgi:hypothetical protein
VAEQVDCIRDVGAPVAVRVGDSNAAWSHSALEKPVQDADGVRDVDVAVVVAVAAAEAR